jgi:hypothetical protein
MNRTEWDASNDPLPMLQWLRGRGSDRKFGLFACECVRRLHDVFEDCELDWQTAVVNAEREIAGLHVLPTPRRRGHTIVFGGGEEDSLARYVLGRLVGDVEWHTARDVAQHVGQLLSVRKRRLPGSLSFTQAGRDQAALLRDLFGHLFHPDPLWLARLDRTDEVERICRAIYDDRSFADLPVLADALEEAGCSDEAVLAHCREPGEHARGCWVIDAVLGRQ